jgi:hypothetical protein
MSIEPIVVEHKHNSERNYCVGKGSNLCALLKYIFVLHYSKYVIGEHEDIGEDLKQNQVGFDGLVFRFFISEKAV